MKKKMFDSSYYDKAIIAMDKMGDDKWFWLLAQLQVRRMKREVL